MRISKRNPETVGAPIGRYSHVVRVDAGDVVWLYVSGQIANDADGAIVGEGDLGRQTEQVFENLRAILEDSGATFDDVVKITTYLTTLDRLEAMREVRSRYTQGDPPASTAVQVVALVVPEAMVEVDLVAVIPTERVPD